MYVLVTQPVTLPCGSYVSGAVLEIPAEWLNRNVMTRLGPYPTAAQLATMTAAGTSFAVLYPTLPALPLQ